MVRVLGLRPDERRTVGLAAAAAATATAGLTIAASSIDALLFSRGGVDDLPVLYVFLGVTMFVATLGVSAVLGRLGRGRTFLVIPASIALIAGVVEHPSSSSGSPSGDSPVSSRIPGKPSGSSR